jgi:hypothetical protein
MEKEKRIILFVSSKSYYYAMTIDNFRKLVDSLGEIGEKFKMDVIDIAKEPEAAEKYNILVQPTLIIGDQYFVGRFENERVTEYLQQYFGKPGKKKSKN